MVNVAQVNGKTLLTGPEIYASFVGSTVGITTEVVTTNSWGQPVSAAAAGSGFVITNDGYILTITTSSTEPRASRSPLWTAPPMTPS